MRFNKLAPLTLIGLFLITLLISFSCSFIQSQRLTAAPKVRSLVFIAKPEKSQLSNSLFLSGSLIKINADRSNRRNLTPKFKNVHAPLVWSPNGEELAFVNKADIYTVNLKTSRTVQLFSGEYCREINFRIAWVLNISKIAFQQACDSFTSEATGSASLYLSDPRKNKNTQLIQSQQRESEFYFSPNGQEVAFIKDGDIYKMSVDGSNPINLTKNPGIYNYSILFWSPDGKKIAFFEGQYPRQEIYWIDSNGGKSTRLTNNENNQLLIGSLAWSPDSQYIAYSQLEDIWGNNQNLYRGNINEPVPQKLTEKAGRYDQIDWSPDGEKIAFVDSTDSSHKIYTINIDGSSLMELTPQLVSQNIDVLTWSPDNQQIAFTTDENDKTALYIVNTSDLKLTQISSNGAYAVTWQPS